MQFDKASRKFPIIRLLAAKRARSRTWALNVRLDQGKDGACVGFGITHELAAAPAMVPNMTAQYAKETIYWGAQKTDDWPGGSYPGASPFYEGTSVLAGVKTAQNLGWFDSYHWAFSIDDLILGIGYNGPAVLGVNWYEGMMEPDDKGFVHPTGKIAGGHCILNRAVDMKNERFRLPNSWGRSWGTDGECFLSFKDMERLQKEDGEAVFFVGRHTVARPK